MSVPLVTTEAVTYCPNCEDEVDELVPLYECSRCGQRHAEEDAEGRRCPDCHIFMARVDGEFCPNCHEEAELVTRMVDREAEAKEREANRERHREAQRPADEERARKRAIQSAFWDEHAWLFERFPPQHPESDSTMADQLRNGFGGDFPAIGMGVSEPQMAAIARFLKEVAG